MMTQVLKGLLMVGAAMLSPSIAMAQDQAVVPQTMQGAPEQIAAPFAEAVDESDLRNVAGREDVNQLSYANQVAGVSRNSVGNNSTTGDARISDNAFQNMSGLSILNINTGNNVAINAAMNVNISITPGQ